MDFSSPFKFGVLFSALLLPSAHADPTVLNKQIREVYSKSACAAATAGSEGDEGDEGDEEDKETTKAQKALDAEYQKKLDRLIKQTLDKKDTKSKERADNIEATLRFFAPAIVGSRFHTPIADEDSISKFSSTNLVKKVAQDADSFEKNQQGLDESKSSFLAGTFFSKDGSKTSLNSEQKERMDTLRMSLLEVLLANGSCGNFDLEAARFTQKFFSSEDKAKEFASDPSHLESFERCEGPLIRKSTSSAPPAPVKNSEQFMDCPDLTSFFQDNQWELEPDALMAANSKTYKKSTCQEHVLTTPGCADSIERNQFLGNLEREGKSRYALAQDALKQCVDRLKSESGKNLQITGVDIDSSASRFRNTGIACEKSFADLSAARANSAKGLLLHIFGEQQIPTKDLPVTIDSGGEWGKKIDSMKADGSKVDAKVEKLRGTSGPAPIAGNKSEFDQYKYVKIRIRYKTSTPVIPPVEKSQYTVICRGLDYASCEASESDNSDGGSGRKKSTKLKHMKGAYKPKGGGDSSGPAHTKPASGRKHATCEVYN
ncbi:MAG: hypothetical protein EBX52_05795 [Proteobacteria bacterium]|nr:hypothetical protein [Pseudomonadota bacterium]